MKSECSYGRSSPRSKTKFKLLHQRKQLTGVN